MTSENAQVEKKQMQPVDFCIHSGNKLETHSKLHTGEKQTNGASVHLLHSRRGFSETAEKIQTNVITVILNPFKQAL